ncbi:HNH endonuclease [Leptothrix sp. BB-4]
MKHYVQYHNEDINGPLGKGDGMGRFVISASKSINHLVGQRVWLVSGSGKPRRYRLEYTFTVDHIVNGTPNRAIGYDGERFDPAPLLNDTDWGPAFVKSQQNFSLGVREIPTEWVERLHALVRSESAGIEDAIVNLTADHYLAALQQFEPSMSSAQRAMLLGHAAAPHASLSMSALARLGNYRGIRPANLQYGALAGKIAAALRVDMRGNDNVAVLATPDRSIRGDDDWQWRLRPQVLDAVHALWPDEVQAGNPDLQGAALAVDAENQGRHLTATERAALILARIGQGRYRADLLDIWDGRCALTGCAVPAALIASHAKAWRDCSHAERLDPHNGLLLAASVDRLFDAGLIGFDDRGRLLMNPSLSAGDLATIGVAPGARLRQVHPALKPYLRHHREQHGLSERDERRQGSVDASPIARTAHRMARQA